jgi:hypothetical protein
VDKASQYISHYHTGDLVSIYFGPGIGEEVGIFMEFDNNVGVQRSMIFWDGEIYSIPTHQITAISKVS